MMLRTNRRIAILPSLLVAILFAAAPALAGGLDAARAAGQVGERLDGYVGIVVANPSPELSALVADINARRNAKYAAIAAANDSPVAQVAAIAAEKLIARSASGHFVQGANGSWVRKP